MIIVASTVYIVWTAAKPELNPLTCRPAVGAACVGFDIAQLYFASGQGVRIS